MKDNFGYDERWERKLMVLLKFVLFNLRTKLVGVNEIQTMFMLFLSVEAQCFTCKQFFSLHRRLGINFSSALVHVAQTYSRPSSPSCTDDGGIQDRRR